MKKWIVPVLGLCLLGAGCFSNSPQKPSIQNPVNPPSSMPSPTTDSQTDLKNQLETTHARALAALHAKDMSGFLAVLEPAKAADVAQLQEHWDAASEALLDLLPDLPQTRFIKVDQQGDWAGYYIQTDLEDENYTSLTMILFHHVDGMWKESGNGESASFPKASDAQAEQKRIDDELKTNEQFQLPS